MLVSGVAITSWTWSIVLTIVVDFPSKVSDMVACGVTLNDLRAVVWLCNVVVMWFNDVGR